MATSGAASDCGVRCFNERKTYCKDLQKWGRNLLYMIGSLFAHLLCLLRARVDDDERSSYRHKYYWRVSGAYSQRFFRFFAKSWVGTPLMTLMTDHLFAPIAD
jgi:hypothetical protein